jgi:chitinase
MRKAILLAIVLATVSASAQKRTARLPERFVAPYVDAVRLTDDLATMRKQSGIRYFTLAFVTAGEGCVPTWIGKQPVATDAHMLDEVRRLRSHGGDVIVAFGGYDGAELAQTCSDVESLKKAYQAVVDAYHPMALDFDIEHFAIDDQPSIDRRSAAMKELADENPHVRISLTLPATPMGLTAKALNVLASAKAQGVRVDVVNLMTMDYGKIAVSKEMGDNAIQAAQGAIEQLKQMGLNAKLGVTPMLGVNDAEGEIFTLADAAAVVAFAQGRTEIVELAYWSAGRDSGDCPQQLSPACSGIAQVKWEFARIFARFH